MKKEFTNIEDLFKDSFNNFKVEPTKGVWKKINSKLNVNQFFSPDFKHFNIFYLSTIIVVIAIVGALLFNLDDTQIAASLDDANKNEVITNKHSSFENNERTINNNIKEIVVEEKTQKELQLNLNKSKSSRVSEVIPLTQNQKIITLSQSSEDSITDIKQLMISAPKPLFKLSNKEGCVPFEIQLKNFTELAQSYEWSFGDGSTSKDASPSHVYLYPGVYSIKLKANGLGGIAYSVIDSIVVHDGINNKISSSIENEILEGQQFTVSAKNSRSASYEWNFGDGSYSNKSNPVHAYQKNGNYTISLKTWTKDNCYDSIKVSDVVVLKSSDLIMFPNAFYPNQNGPSGGKYNSRDIYYDIFHPKVKGQVTEYSLIIYSRAGSPVFETNDVKIGWDGYFRNRLMPEGVYPYIVSVMFENGLKTIQRGNVTVLHRK